MTTPTPTHVETEHDPWSINIGDHPARADTPLYGRSRKHMIAAVQGCQPWFFGDPPYQDHHGGGVWVWDRKPLLVFLPVGIEWSAQFCADPAKVEQIRQGAERLVFGFPRTEGWYTSTLGMAPGDLSILHEPIVDDAGIARWTDSFWNASVPLPADKHTGTLPKGAGYHHYPKPIVDIEMFKRDDFVLFHNGVAVAPVAPRGSGNGAVRVLYDPLGRIPEGTELPAGHPIARAAFALQTGEIVTTSDPAPTVPNVPTTDPPAPLVAPPWTTVSFWLSILGTVSGIVVAVLAGLGHSVTIQDSVVSGAALLFSTVLGSVYAAQAAKTQRHVATLRLMLAQSEAGAYNASTLHKKTLYRG